MGSAATGFVKNNKKVTWKEFARMLAVLAVPIAMQNLLATTASMVDTIMIGSEGEIAVCFQHIGDLSAAPFCSCLNTGVPRIQRE